MRILTGETFNVLRRAVLDVSSGIARADYPVGNVADQKSSEPVMFTAAGTPRRVDADLDLLASAGAFESLDGWTESNGAGGSSALDDDPRPDSEGDNSVELDPGGTFAERWKDVRVRAGQRLLIRAWSTNAGDTTAFLRIQNRTTGLYLQEEGGPAQPGEQEMSWTDAVEAALSWTNGIWQERWAVFQVEDYETCRQDEVLLRVFLRVQGFVHAWFDDVELIPAVDAASLHGHNVPPSAVITVRSSDGDLSTFTTRFTLSGAQPACGAVLAEPIFHRYWRLDVADAIDPPDEVLFLAEWVLGQTYVLSEQPRHEALTAWHFGARMQQVAGSTELGEDIRVNLSSRAQRARVYPFRDELTDSLIHDLQHELFERTRYGALPFVLFPDDATDEVLLVRIDSEWAADSLPEGMDGWDRTLSVRELPFPVLVS